MGSEQKEYDYLLNSSITSSSVRGMEFFAEVFTDDLPSAIWWKTLLPVLNLFECFLNKVLFFITFALLILIVKEI